VLTIDGERETENSFETPKDGRSADAVGNEKERGRRRREALDCL